MPFEAAQIAAVKLARRVAAAAFRKPVPLALHGPVRPRRAFGGAGRREPVREDLVHDRACMPRRSARIEGEHEVVGAGDLVRMHAEAVHPAVAGEAAVDEPAVANRCVRDGQVGPPPRPAAGILVHDRLRGVRLAVGDVAQPDLLRRAVRRAQSYRGGPAHPIRPVDDVQLRAVVMRLGQSRRALTAHDRHPFTAPCERPLTMKRCSQMKSAAAGTAAMSAPAAKKPQRCPNCWSMKPRMPTGSVKWWVVTRIALAITYSFSVAMNDHSPTTARIGSASGRITPQKIWPAVAPSTRADSSNSFGMESKKPFISHVFTPIAPPR